MEVKNIPLERVYPSPMNPRKTFGETELKELAENIEKQGLLQPITVRPKKNHSEDAEFDPFENYEIVCGERRYRAFVQLHDRHIQDRDSFVHFYEGFRYVPAIVRQMTDDEAFEAMITENLQRKEVDPMEEAYAFLQLVTRNKKSVEEIALKFGKSVRFVQDRIKLNSLIPDLRDKVKADQMAISAGQIICKLDEDKQKAFLKQNKNSEYIRKEVAQYFVDRLFLELKNSPWYENNHPDYEGSCGVSCSQCQFNTANQGCLFYDMRKDQGRCTNQKRYDEKAFSFILDEVENCGLDLVKKGEPLDKGKTVLYINEEWAPEGFKQLRDKVKEKLSETYEIGFSNGGIFSYEIHGKDEEEKERILNEGEGYQVLKLFTYGSVRFQTAIFRFKDQPQKAKEVDEVERLLDKRNSLESNTNIRFLDVIREIAESTDVSGMDAELTDTEKAALTYILFHELDNKTLQGFGLKYKGDDAAVDYVRNNIEKRNLWLRLYILQEIRNKYCYSNLMKEAAVNALGLWSNEFYASMNKIEKDIEQKLQDNALELEKLGYDTDGNPLEKSVSQ